MFLPIRCLSGNIAILASNALESKRQTKKLLLPTSENFEGQITFQNSVRDFCDFEIT